MRVIKNLKYRISNVLYNDKGTTMMEVLVSFVVLMVILVALTRAIFLSSELRMRAMDTGRIMQTFNKCIYSTEIKNSESFDKVKRERFTTNNIEISDGKYKGPLFYITPDEDKNVELWVTEIDANCFTYDPDDSTVSSENLVIPKAIMFEHKTYSGN